MDDVEEIPTCPRCGGVHASMYEPSGWKDEDDEDYPWDMNDE